MFQAEVYSKQRLYKYRNGGLIPPYDNYAIKIALKEGRFKETNLEEHSFTAYGSTREETLHAIDRIAELEKVTVSRIEFIDW